MTCLYPVPMSPNSDDPIKRYYKNGKKGDKILVPCRHCVNCIDTRIREWTYRLLAESKKHTKMAFITLTYDDEHLPRNCSCCSADVSKFIKRIRRYYEYHGGKKLELAHFSCTEYGGLGRPHAHLLILGIDYNDLLPSKIKVASHNTKNCFSPFWKKGLLNFGTDVSLQDSRMIRYVTKYVEKLDTDNLYKYCRIMGIEKPQVLHSVKLGTDYLKTRSDEDGKLPRLGGIEMNLNPYYMRVLDLCSPYTLADKKRFEIEREKTRNIVMQGMENTDDNYAHQIEIMKRGIV